VGVHDVNIDFDRACEVAGKWLREQGLAALGSGRDFMTALRRTTIGLYEAAHEYAHGRGLILADTKFEFGVNPEGDVLLVDEALTPDSSRYWDASRWQPGGEQPSYDKQFLREYLNGLTARGQWNKQAPGPELPDEVVRGTASRYEQVQRLLWPT
jgi:phosphoribosylaminoimidazole-succinocarboxamide synthase